MAEPPPERVGAIVTDVAQMGRLSPECTGGRWLDGATAPTVGARFKGSNKRGIARWSTTLLLGGEDGHTDELRDGMRQTLERLKAIAETS